MSQSTLFDYFLTLPKAIEIQPKLIPLIPNPKKRELAELLSTADQYYEETTNKRPKHYAKIDNATKLNIIEYHLEEDCTYDDTISAFEDLDLKISTVSSWVTEYKRLLDVYGKDENGIELARQDFLKSKRGRPSILPDSMENKLVDNVKSITDVGGKITPHSISLIAKATIDNSTEPDEMKEIMIQKITMRWSRSFLSRIGYVKRKPTTNRLLTSEEENSAKNVMMSIMYKVSLYNPNLVLMMDETMAPYSPIESYTYAPSGTKEVKVRSFSTKKGCTVTFTITKSNVLLPCQIIWEGLTPRSIPNFKSPDGFYNVYAGATGNDGKRTKTNKWQNRKTILEYISKIVSPYLKKQRKENPNEPALLIMDNHWSHMDKVIDDPLKDLNVTPVYLPPNTTHLYCVLDLSVNKPFKAYYRQEYDSYCVGHLSKQLVTKNADEIDMNMSLTLLKPLVGKWIGCAWKKLKENEEEIVSNGWKQVEKNLL